MDYHLRPGLTGETHLTVAEANTARHLGSGGVAVLATPEMVRLMEQAAVAAVDHLLPEGYQTVGAHLDVKHLAPTPLGFKVTARAELTQVEDRRLTFRVEAYDDQERIGEGAHARVIIDVARFLSRLQAKQSK
jgi:fluoroacetyl-CoA thioesterase